MLVSKYGFSDLSAVPGVSLDPSRVAAQVVSGIGFIGGGLIFVRRDIVRGLTTAATVWLAAAVGMAAGAGLPVLAAGTTVGHFVITLGLPPVARALARRRAELPVLRLAYLDGHGVLRNVLAVCTEQGWAVHGVEVDREGVTEEGDRVATVLLQLVGRGDLPELAAEIAQLPGVRTARTVPRTSSTSSSPARPSASASIRGRRRGGSRARRGSGRSRPGRRPSA